MTAGASSMMVRTCPRFIMYWQIRKQKNVDCNEMVYNSQAIAPALKHTLSMIAMNVAKIKFIT